MFSFQIKLWTEASKDLLWLEKWMDEQAAAPVFLLSPKFSPITISLRADRILPGWKITNCPPVTKWCNHPGNTDHSVPSTDWGRGPFLLSTPPKPFSISVSVTNIWNLICR